MIDTLIVIAKEPVAGRVKTRLTPPLSAEHAAQVAAGALADTLSAVQGAPAGHRWLAFDGDVDGWLPDGWHACEQPDDDLDRRLVAAFRAVGPGAAILVGMDTPQVSSGQLSAFDTKDYDACLGLAPDGGYWAIGFRDPSLAAPAILGISMSTRNTGADQLRRLHRLGLRVQMLDELRDVDTISDADAVAALIPGSAFAAALDLAAPCWPTAAAVR